VRFVDENPDGILSEKRHVTGGRRFQASASSRERLPKMDAGCDAILICVIQG
jgi:hypothetical protein